MTRVGGDAFEYEMIRVQRKRAPTLEGAGSEDATSDGGDATIAAHGGMPPSSGERWVVLETGADSSNDESRDDEDDDDKSKLHKRKRKSRATAPGLPLGNAALGAARHFLYACMSIKAIVAIGLVWCGVLALLLVKSLWFYKWAVPPLEKSLGKELKTEAEPIIVALVLVAPFTVTGLVFYGFQPQSPRWAAISFPPIVEKLRLWRRQTLGGRLDSIDVAVVAVFAIIQVNALVGKLLIDQYNGKIAKSGYLNRGGRALGMNGFYAVLLSIVLVSRRSFIHQFLNLSSERAARYHIWCGNFGAITLVVHGLVYTSIWTMEGKVAESLFPCFDCGDKKAYKALRNFSGLVAQVMLLAVALASLERVRRQHFRRFAFVHCLNVLFVVATCLHYYPAAYWFAAPVMVYIMYRVVSVFNRSRSTVVSARALDDAIVQLQLRRDAAKLGSHDFVPGQYVYIKVDEISKNEWHPISISSSPLRDQSTLSLDIKVQGPFTAQLLQMVKAQSLSTVQLDGYYGTGIEVSRNMVFIAGGSGMTPFLSVLEHLLLLSQQSGNDEMLLPTRLWIVWTARDLSLVHAHKPLLDQVRHSSVWKARVWLHCTKAVEEERCRAESVDAKPVAVDGPLAQPTAPVSYTLVFGATAVGAIGAMLLVLSSPSLTSVWWVKRQCLLFGGVVGALAGGSWIFWRALSSRAGFERVNTDTADVDQSGDLISSRGPSKSTGIAISRARPDVDAILREVHSTTHDVSGAVRVLVSGPSELQQRVVDASKAFQAPLFSVEKRSFAL